jgi:hypothetical protein
MAKRVANRSIDLPRDLYDRLTRQARASGKRPEELVVERLSSDLGATVPSRERALEMARQTLTPRVGRLLQLGKPTLDLKGPTCWRIPVRTNVEPRRATVVGEVLIEVFSGRVLTPPEELRRLTQVALETLDFKRFPPKKAARLSRLLKLHKEERLTPKQRREFEALMAEVDKLELNNLERVVAQLQIEG